MDTDTRAKTINDWFSEYGESHQNRVNRAIHTFAVPLIMLSVLGLLWELPFPFKGALPFVNWALVASVFGLIFYARLSFTLFIGMTLVVILQMMLLYWVDTRIAIPLWLISFLLFVVSWIFQFIGHYVEGRRPSFLQDLQFLLIGPIWVLASLYRVIGVRY